MNINITKLKLKESIRYLTWSITAIWARISPLSLHHNSHAVNSGVRPNPNRPNRDNCQNPPTKTDDIAAKSPQNDRWCYYLVISGFKPSICVWFEVKNCENKVGILENKFRVERSHFTKMAASAVSQGHRCQLIDINLRARLFFFSG